MVLLGSPPSLANRTTVEIVVARSPENSFKLCYLFGTAKAAAREVQYNFGYSVQKSESAKL